MLKRRLLKNNFKEEDIFIKEIKTKGDQVQNVRLSEVGGKGLFSSNIERELQRKKNRYSSTCFKRYAGN